MQNNKAITQITQIKSIIATQYPQLAIVPLCPSMSGDADILYAICFKEAEHCGRTYANTRAVISATIEVENVFDTERNCTVGKHYYTFGLLQNNYYVQKDGTLEESAQVWTDRDDTKFLIEILDLCANTEYDAYDLAGIYCSW